MGDSGCIPDDPRFSQADLKLRESAETADGANSRKRFATFKGNSLDHMRDPTSCFQKLVGHPFFDWFFAVVVLLNAIFIGVDVQLSIGTIDLRPMHIQVMQYCFTSLFTIELALRFAANGLGLLCLDDWMWSLLDVFIVDVWLKTSFLFLGAPSVASDGPSRAKDSVIQCSAHQCF